MKVWTAILRGFAFVWLTLVGLYLVAGIVGTWRHDGFFAVQRMMNPFNVRYYLSIALIAAPGVGALMWGEKLAAKSRAPSPAGVDAQTIIRAYGAVMASGNLIADISELPYPKPEIKAAIVSVLLSNPDSKIREQLRSAYVTLANWQEGVGPDPRAFDLTTHFGGDDIVAEAKRVSAASPAIMEMEGKVIAEMQRLLAELKALGF